MRFDRPPPKFFDSSSPTDRTPRNRLVLAGLAALALCGSQPALSERLILDGGTAGGERVVLIADGDATVVREGESAVRVELPEGAWLNRIAALTEGWVAGGTRATVDGQELFLLLRDPEATHEIELPFERLGRIRQSAVPLVERGRLVGLAWLEGDDFDSLAVRAATLDDGAWGPAETVSPPAPGGQVALSGIVAPETGPLLVWSRHDGVDVDTFWSRLSADGLWTPPAPLHEPNGVPDVTPALIGLENGPLAAWVRYDGGTTRVRLARFDGEGWTDTGFAGPAASVYPTLTPTGGGARLIFPTVVPRGWTVLELDRRGEPARRARVEETTRERPLIADDGRGRASFIWPATEADATGLAIAADWEAPE